MVYCREDISCDVEPESWVRASLICGRVVRHANALKCSTANWTLLREAFFWTWIWLLKINCILLLCIFGHKTSVTGVKRAATITLHANSHLFCEVSIWNIWLSKVSCTYLSWNVYGSHYHQYLNTSQTTNKHIFLHLFKGIIVLSTLYT